ncbi:class I SAM-dependent methyltransferase [candidate division KSB1 bacterium]|nr:class I SAM-dependent methyltransferase [candidate division KSB1 bacterium]
MNFFYTKKFFKAIEHGSQRSAEEIVPLVLELSQPRSVIDVGCGVGTWLKVFKQHGVHEVLGVDGSYVDQSLLQISKEEFLPFDLRKPLRLDKKFDLVLSLEVAEHLPPECADTFVASLVGLGSVVLFSAAIPFQGGTNHVNAQWPDYWMQKFQSRGYVPVDCLRRRIWQNQNVEWWYAQNLLLYVEHRRLAEYPRLLQEFEKTCVSQLCIAHPHLVEPQYMSPRRLLEALPIVMWHGKKRRLARFSHG